MLGVEALKLEKTEKARAHKLVKKKRIPRELIYEMRYGKPIYLFAGGKTPTVKGGDESPQGKHLDIG